MKQLNLDKCKTNNEVCKLVKEKILSISYSELQKEVDKNFIFQEEATKAIYTGLSMNMNIYLSGPGGYGKTSLVKWVLQFYKIPYHTIIGYKDMPVDALLGIPDMKKLLNESEYELNFSKSLFCKPGILLFEEASDVLPATAAALKDILTEGGFRNKYGKTESLISNVIITANKSAKEIVDDESKKALYEERFPIKASVNWESYKTVNYYKFLLLIFPDAEIKKLHFLAKLFEYNFEKANNCISPRQAINISKVFLISGITFLSSFNLDLTEVIYLSKQSEKESIMISFEETLEDIFKTIQATEKDTRWQYLLYAQVALENIRTTNETSKYLADFKKRISLLSQKTLIPSEISMDIDTLLKEYYQ